jgi:DNA-binding HxlR family transcriptional regulator
MSSEPTAVSGPRSGVLADRPLFAEPEEIFDGVQDVLGRKWHLRIVYQLLENGPMGFSALKTETAGVSSKMLSESLSSLEEVGIVDRTVVSEQPVRVEYSLTERGRALEGVVSAVIHWGHEFGPDGEFE